MAGKELKATEKTVLKHSRDGVLEQNLADGSAKKVSNKAEEAVHSHGLILFVLS